MKRAVAAACVLMVGAMAALGGIVYYDDCSTADGWQIIANPSGNAFSSSDGSYMSFTEPNGGMNPGNAATWGTDQMNFDPNYKAYYTLTFEIQSLTGSASYKFAIDEFDSGGNWLNTIWNVYPVPEAERSTIGVSGPDSIVIGLGSFSYSNATARIAPKFDLTTGDPNQTLQIDSVTLSESIPEPASMALLGAGLALAFAWKRSKSRRMA